MNANYFDLSKEELEESLKELKQNYQLWQKKNLSLDMTRGKPSPEQLDLCLDMLDLPGKENFKTPSDLDTRNYGGLDGLPELKSLFGAINGISPDQIIVGGNSSLNMMHDAMWRAITFGVCGSPAWKESNNISFLCPVPGYDRHFAATEHFGINMININMTAAGPDMDQIEELVAKDDSIKGIWIVPKYSNPTGITCSKDTVNRLANMQTKAKDFRIFWDNAYAEHHISDKPDQLENIYDACKNAGHEDRVFMFCSTSKISFAGSGVSAMGASPSNIIEAKKHLALQTIGPDKINQLRHLQFFKDLNGLRDHMKKHKDILAPKFQKVIDVFDRELNGTRLATWTKPNGGYFVSLDVSDRCAGNVVTLAAQCGVKLTKAGATYPYGKDPKDTNIRIAPSLPSIAQIDDAMKIVCICVKIAGIEKLLGS